MLKEMPFGVHSCPTILSKIYSSFVGNNCSVFSVIYSFSELSCKHVGAFLQLSVARFVKDGIGAALSMEIVLWIPFSSMVIVCDDKSMTQ